MKIDLPDRPMMSEAEIAYIGDLLDLARPSCCCLEWGCGSSTLHFSNARGVRSWLSVEHNGHYAGAVMDEADSHVNVIWVQGESYVDCVRYMEGRFDFILIDGDQREKCLEMALHIAKPETLIFLHDAGREEYQEFIKKHHGEMIMQGEEPYRGFYKHRGLARFTKQ